ncbi:MAG: DUF4249 domain-containing protein [Dinghuibacter sp.]|nr:DUF4249 domain-containing protein [Dinghuibacter sp.]
MKKTIIVISISAAALFAGCERTLDIDVPEHQPRLVLGMLQETGTPLRAQVSRSKGILAPRNPGNPNNGYQVSNALVLVYENNVVTDTLKYNATELSYTTRTNKVFLPGVQYRVTAAASGFNTVESTVKAPLPVPINSISRVRNARSNSLGEVLDDILVNFTDPGSEKNYYMVSIQTPYFSGGAAVSYYQVNCIYSNDVDIDRLDASGDPFGSDNCLTDEVLLNDNNFNGRAKQLRLSVPGFYIDEVVNTTNGRVYRPFIELMHITESQYRYLKSRQVYNNAADNPFAEPALVYTNITNGYGVLGIQTTVRDSIR